MMTHRDRRDASMALMDWFESQGMSVGEAATVMALTLGSMASLTDDALESINSVARLAMTVAKDMR